MKIPCIVGILLDIDLLKGLHLSKNYFTDLRVCTECGDS